MKNIILTIIIMLLSFVGCKKYSDNPVGPSGSTGFYNLKIGNSITEIWNEYSTINNKDSLIKQYEFTSTILRDTVFGGFTWYSDNDKWYPDEIWIANKNDGFWQADRQTDGSFDVSMIFKFPCKKGDSFTSIGGNICQVISIDTTISVTAGTFKCIQYRLIGKQPSWTEDSFISPGIGGIKDISIAYQSKIVIELKSYSFK